MSEVSPCASRSSRIAAAAGSSAIPDSASNRRLPTMTWSPDGFAGAECTRPGRPPPGSRAASRTSTSGNDRRRASVDHGQGQRMAAGGLGGCRQPQDLVGGAAARHDQTGELRQSLGQRSGLVEGERVALRQALEGRPALDQDAVSRQPGHAGEHRRRSRQHQAARARDHQHGHHPRPDVGPAREITRQAASPIATTSTTGRKYRASRSASFSTRALRRRAWATSLITWPKVVRSPTFSVSTSITPNWFIVPVKTGSPGPLSIGSDSPVKADWSTVEWPVTTRAVDRNTLAGPHDHPIADRDLVRGDFDFLAVAAHPRGPRRLLDQPAHGSPGARKCPRFENFAQ